MADPLESAANIFEKLVSDFTWTRFTFVVFLLVAVVLSSFVFESYTRHFALSRIDTEIRALSELARLSPKVPVTADSAQFQRGYDHLLAKLNAQIDGESFQLDQLPIWASNAIYAAIPWLFMSFFLLLATKTGRAKAYAGMATVALPFVIVGGLIPEFGRNWINHWAYPWGTMVLCVCAIVLLQKRKARRISVRT
jgi:hypothetical protein